MQHQHLIVTGLSLLLLATAATAQNPSAATVTNCEYAAAGKLRAARPQADSVTFAANMVIVKPSENKIVVQGEGLYFDRGRPDGHRFTFDCMSDPRTGQTAVLVQLDVASDNSGGSRGQAMQRPSTRQRP